MKQTIDIVRGTSLTVNISVVSSNGVPYVLSSTDRLRFCVKSDPNDIAGVIEKVLTSSNYSNGVYVLQLSPSDTESLPCGRYYYDCGLQIGSQYYMIIELSQFNITQNISKRQL